MGELGTGNQEKGVIKEVIRSERYVRARVPGTEPKAEIRYDSKLAGLRVRLMSEIADNERLFKRREECIKNRTQRLEQVRFADNPEKEAKWRAKEEGFQREDEAVAQSLREKIAEAQSKLAQLNNK
jgi:hypothetical protein